MDNPIVRLFALLLLLTLSACNVQKFLVGVEEPVDCRVLSPVGSVRSTLYSFDMRGGGVVAMTRRYRTLYRLTVDLRLDSGTGVRIYPRANVQGSAVIDTTLAISLSKAGSTFDSAGITLANNRNARLESGVYKRLVLYTENNELSAILDCDTITRRWTNVWNTDDILIKTNDDTRLQVLNPAWRAVQRE